MPTWEDLNAVTWRVGVLTAAGWSVGKIASTLGEGAGREFTDERVRRIRREAAAKLGLSGTIAFALCAADNLLPRQKDEWRERAEAYRDKLRQSQAFDPITVHLAMLLADPRHCDKTHTELGRMLPARALGHRIVTARLRTFWSQLGEDTNLTKLAVALHLAPFAFEEEASQEAA